MEEMFTAYQQAISVIEERLEYLSGELSKRQTVNDLANMRRRREVLAEERLDLLYAIGQIADYISVRNENSCTSGDA